MLTAAAKNFAVATAPTRLPREDPAVAGDADNAPGLDGITAYRSGALPVALRLVESRELLKGMLDARDLMCVVSVVTREDGAQDVQHS
jgi:hypothetical protein